MSTYTAKFIVPNKLNGQRTWLLLLGAEGLDLSFFTFDPMAHVWVVTGIGWPVSYGVSTGKMVENRLTLMAGMGRKLSRQLWVESGR